jgi:predicted dehydrogenase
MSETTPGVAPDPEAAPVRWGIAGTGRIASDFAEDLALLPGARLAAVGSRSQESADAFADRFGIPNRHVGYENLAADPEVDAVYVAVPHTGHCDVVLTAIAGGKAVLCEKPFSVNAGEAERMVAAAAAAGVPLMEAMWVRFLPHFIALRELLGEGAVGEVRSFTGDRGALLSTDPEHRVLNPALAGGALLDLGVYPVSLASMVFGGRAPERIEALMRPAVTGVDAQISMLFGYESGAHALISTALDTQSANQVSVVGTAGRIDLPEVWSRSGPLFLTTYEGGESRVYAFEHEGNGLRHQAGEVGRLLRAGLTESPVIPWQETVDVMRTMDRVREAAGLRYPGE